eukprot:10891762-Alexandrium_andersonii.AAC.1
MGLHPHEKSHGPSGPARANCPGPALGIDSESRRPRSFGAARRGRPELQLKGLPTSADSERGARMFRPCWPAGTAASSNLNEAPIHV